MPSSFKSRGSIIYTSAYTSYSGTSSERIVLWQCGGCDAIQDVRCQLHQPAQASPASGGFNQNQSASPALDRAPDPLPPAVATPHVSGAAALYAAWHLDTKGTSCIARNTHAGQPLHFAQLALPAIVTIRGPPLLHAPCTSASVQSDTKLVYRLQYLILQRIRQERFQ